MNGNCNRQLIGIKNAIVHINQHRKRAINCKICGEEYTNDGSLLKHNQQKHQNELKFNLISDKEKQNKIRKHFGIYEQIYNTDKPKNNLKLCDQKNCKSRFKGQIQKARHMFISHKLQFQFYKSKTESNWDNKPDQDLVPWKGDEQQFQTSYTQRKQNKFIRWNRYENSNYLICDIQLNDSVCGQKFDWIIQYNNHQLLVHPEKVRNNFCGICGIYSHNNINNHLINHENGHSAKAEFYTFKCDQYMYFKQNETLPEDKQIKLKCKRKFYYKNFLTWHQVTTHDYRGLNKKVSYNCMQCDKQFSYHTTLRAHDRDKHHNNIQKQLLYSVGIKLQNEQDRPKYLRNQWNHAVSNVKISHIGDPIDFQQFFLCCKLFMPGTNNYCTEKFYRIEEMKKHAFSHGYDTRHQCQDCYFTSKKGSVMIEHFHNQHGYFKRSSKKGESISIIENTYKRDVQI